jgi:hypothetical protein
VLLGLHSLKSFELYTSTVTQLADSVLAQQSEMTIEKAINTILAPSGWVL